MDIKSLFRDRIAPTGDKIKDEWVKKHLLRLPANKSLIDIGAGEMPFKKFCSHLKYKSQDLGKYTGMGVKKGVQTGKYDTKNVDIISDITSIPVKDSFFDYILCTEVFEHIPDPLSALKEMNRITKKGGGIILTSPFASLTHFYPYFFYSGFSEEFYKVNLPRFGYKIKEIYIIGNYFSWLAIEFLRMPYVVFGYNKVLFLFLLPLVVLAIPWWITLRILSKIFTQSNDLLAFSICVFARKIS